MNSDDFKKRTKAFSIRVVKLVESLPRVKAADVMGRQLLRSATSVGANYRAACRSVSKAAFIAKMAIVEEECDESIYWMELLVETGLVKETLLESLIREADEILSMVVASLKTARLTKGKS